MAQWFEDLTKLLADERLSRRQVAQRIAATVAGAALATWLPGQAFAQGEFRRLCCCPNSCGGPVEYSCFDGCNITCTGDQFCPCDQYSSNKYNNCYCFLLFGTAVTTGGCGCNILCSSAAPCTQQSDCATGYFCAYGTGCNCNGGVCIPYCTRTCQPPASDAGRTAILLP